jgi:hypothetical protein
MDFLTIARNIKVATSLYFIAPVFWYTPRDTYAVAKWCHTLRDYQYTSPITNFACVVPNHIYDAGNYTYNLVPTPIATPFKIAIDHLTHVNTLRFMDMAHMSSRCFIEVATDNHIKATTDCATAAYSIATSLNGMYHDYIIDSVAKTSEMKLRACKNRVCSKAEFQEIIGVFGMDFDISNHWRTETLYRDILDFSFIGFNDNSFSIPNFAKQVFKASITEDMAEIVKVEQRHRIITTGHVAADMCKTLYGDCFIEKPVETVGKDKPENEYWGSEYGA